MVIKPASLEFLQHDSPYMRHGNIDLRCMQEITLAPTATVCLVFFPHAECRHHLTCRLVPNVNPHKMSISKQKYFGAQDLNFDPGAETSQRQPNSADIAECAENWGAKIQEGVYRPSRKHRSS